MTAIDRRSFLRRGAALSGGALLSSSAMVALNTAVAGADDDEDGDDEGRRLGGLVRMRPACVDTSYPGAADIEWLALPRGFRYAVLGVTGDALTDGNVTPSAHDGMAAFRRRGGVTLVRNHENRDVAASSTPLAASNAYNPAGGAGCTTLDLSFRSGKPRVERSYVSLNGTIVNCAGGLTPSGSWISSEESTETRNGIPHGYNFEVPANAGGPVVPVPLKAMGRFDHEAVAVDPRTGIVYETEDDGDSGLYRYLPNDTDDLAAGGVLQMLRVPGMPDLSGGFPTGQRFQAEWVIIPNPDPADGETSVKQQGQDSGGTLFARLEGCWWGDRSLFFAATNGGAVGEGQIWEYRPRGHNRGVLTLVFESPSGEVLSAPDNITVTPNGGLILCEDHGFDRPRDPFAPLPWVDQDDDDAVEVQYLKYLDPRGRLQDFAANLLDDKEFAGACFSPDGRYLFANTQGTTRNFDPANPADHGRTYVIWRADDDDEFFSDDD